MKEARIGRGLRATVCLVMAGVIAIAISAAGGTSARAALASSKACAPKGSQGHLNRFGGVITAVPVDACVSSDDAPTGDPPLIWHNGPVMGTNTTGPVVVTPIFWHPAGHPMDSAYESIIKRYLGDVAADSGRHTNVFSTLTEYFGTNGFINYQLRLGTSVDDTNPLPANGCQLTTKDRTGIYGDGSGYDACLDDSQVSAETARVVNAGSLPVNMSHIYVLFLPKHVETCFLGGSVGTTRKGYQACTINHEKSAGYCAYHFISGQMVYANLSYPIYDSPVGYTCSSDAVFPTVQTPNGNADADTEVSPTSHEIMEAITDPDTETGWYDDIGYENGDECAYVFGSTQGTAGQFYNQIINRHHYLTQTEFSNNDFLNTGLGCLQSK
jgi:hypothetical protein